jgi:hypothetical protein
MDKKILILAKSIEKLTVMQLSKDGLLDKKPSVSYISDIALNFPAVISILSDLEGGELVRVLFVAYNLLNGDTDEVAMNRATNIFMFDVKSIQGEEYNRMEDCDVCYGNGEIACEECGGEGEMECSDCNGSGNLNCDECGGEGEVDGEECHYCGGDGEVHCGDCGGSGQVHCDECYGDGKVRCEECDGEGEVESSTEVVDVEMSTIVTQNHKIMEELDSLHDPNDDEITEFGQFIEKYSNEILVIDVINDTEEFDYEWGGDSSVRDKLERTWTNFKNYKVSRNRSKGKNEITALK